jgi:hypothetical protein
MPNQRAKDKVYLGGFVKKQLRDQLSRLARKAGMGDNRFGYAVSLIEKSLEQIEPTEARQHKKQKARGSRA